MNKKFKIIVIITIVFSISYVKNIYAVAYPAPNCLSSPYRDITIFGDSRAAFLNNIERFKNITLKNPDTGIMDIPILDVATLNSIQNLGWPGSMTTTPSYDPTSAIIGHTGGGDWIAHWQGCINQGYPIRTSPKIIISLGGNDVRSAYANLEEKERLYLLYLAFTNPVSFLKAVLTELFSGGKAKSPELEAWWLWNMNAEMDRITNNMNIITQTHLNNLPVTGKLNEVILIGNAPAFSTSDQGLTYDLLTGNTSVGKIIRLGVYMGILQYKYFYHLYKPLLQTYGNRIHYVDSYFSFLKNFVYDNHTFYKADGVHFSTESDFPPNGNDPNVNNGNRELTRYLEIKMGEIGWFPWSA